MGLIRELDLGTPIRVSDTVVTLTIDGQAVSVPKGTSVMAAAAMLGTQVPKLCATDSLEPFGSCRICLVQIEGRRGTRRRAPRRRKRRWWCTRRTRRSRGGGATGWSCTSATIR